MILRNQDKVKILVAGEFLHYGDIAIIKMIKSTYLDKPYYCHCPLRNIGEWFSERHLDKIKNKLPKEMPYPKMKVVSDEVKQPIERQPAVYNNLPSPFKIYKP